MFPQGEGEFFVISHPLPITSTILFFLFFLISNIRYYFEFTGIFYNILTSC